MTQGGRDKILTISRKLRDRVESLNKIFNDLSNLKERYSSPVSNEEKFATIKSCINSLDEIVRSPLAEDDLIDRQKITSCLKCLFEIKDRIGKETLGREASTLEGILALCQNYQMKGINVEYIE